VKSREEREEAVEDSHEANLRFSIGSPTYPAVCPNDIIERRPYDAQDCARNVNEEAVRTETWASEGEVTGRLSVVEKVEQSRSCKANESFSQR